jgi:hypothetical protein
MYKEKITMIENAHETGRETVEVYQPPVLVDAGSFRIATRGLTQIDREIRIGKKAE